MHGQLLQPVSQTFGHCQALACQIYFSWVHASTDREAYSNCMGQSCPVTICFIANRLHHALIYCKWYVCCTWYAMFQGLPADQ